jgi:TatD DNase family protein
VVDTHCHLDSCAPPDAELVQRARAAGVGRLATVGMDGGSIERALGAAREHDGVVAIVGRHPHNAEGFGPSDLEEIERACADPLARGIGETGLDYYRDNAPREDQRRAFEAQLDLAARKEMPVVIHTRAAEDDTFAMLAEHAAQATVVLHCFSAPDRVEECVQRGYFCSFAGNVTYKNAEALQAAAREVPDHLLLVETDSPYLAPVPLRGKPNEPANVVHTAEFVAGLRGLSYDEFDALVESNAARVFGP